MGVAVLKIARASSAAGSTPGSCSTGCRRDYRRRVTRQYLRLPLAWHQRHPTGQLLSNANSDVEAAWFFFAPLPFAVGVAGHARRRRGRDGARRPGAGRWSACVVFPLVFVANVVYQRVMSPRMSRAQQLRAEVSEVAHECFDGALVVKTLGREGAETERFAGRAEELRDGNVSVGRVRGLFDPVIEALPTPGHARRAAGRRRPGRRRRDRGRRRSSRSPTCSPCWPFPIRAIGWVLAELPRALVGWRPGRAVLDATGGMAYGPDDRRAGAGGARGWACSGVDYAFEDADAHPAAAARGRPSTCPPARTVAVVGPTGSGKSTLAGLLVRLVDPVDGAVAARRRRRARVCARARSPPRPPSSPQATFLFDDTVRGNITLGARLRRRRGVGGAARGRRRRLRRRAARRASTPGSGSGARRLSGGQRQRLALARALVRRRGCSCWTTPPAPSTRPSRRGSSTACATRRRRRPSSSSPTGRPTIALADEVV